MDKNLTEIVIISDRSGSMSSCKEAAQSGINKFINEQKELPGKARLTIIDFDDVYTVVCDGLPIKQFVNYVLVPRGNTALFDAMGKAISVVGERLANTPEDQRPGLVVVVISTDGQENSSHEYTGPQIAAMVKEQTEKYSWQFQFLGANIDAISAAQELEIKTSGGIQVAPSKFGAAYGVTGHKVKRMRDATSKGMATHDVAQLGAYTQAERDELAK